MLGCRLTCCQVLFRGFLSLENIVSFRWLVRVATYPRRQSGSPISQSSEFE